MKARVLWTERTEQERRRQSSAEGRHQLSPGTKQVWCQISPRFPIQVWREGLGHHEIGRGADEVDMPDAVPLGPGGGVGERKSMERLI